MQGIAYKIEKALKGLIEYTTAVAAVPFTAGGCAETQAPAVKAPEVQEEPKPKEEGPREVFAYISDSIYQDLQRMVFGDVIEAESGEGINCAAAALDNLGETNRVELCREIAADDMEISSSEFLYWAVYNNDAVAQKYPDVSSMKPTGGSKMYFSDILPKEFLSSNGVEMNVELKTKPGGTYLPTQEHGGIKCGTNLWHKPGWYYNVYNNPKAIVASNESFRHFWPPNGRSILLLQDAFEAFANEIVSELQPEASFERGAYCIWN